MAEEDGPDEQLSRGRKKSWWKLSGAEINQRFEAASKKAAARRKEVGPLTRESVAKKAEQQQLRREQRRASRDPQKQASLLRAGAVVLLLGASGAAAVGISSGAESEADARSQHQQRMAEVSSETEALGGDLPEGDDLQSQIDGYLADARVAADEVAEDQNRFAELYAASNEEDPPGSGLPTESETEAAQHRRALEENFLSDSFTVGDDMVELPTVAEPYDETTIDPRWPWYLQYDTSEQGYVEASQYQWEVLSVMPMAGDAGLVEVVWVNENDDEELLSWAQGRYDGAEGGFVHLQTGTTTIGAGSAVRNVDEEDQ